MRSRRPLSFLLDFPQEEILKVLAPLPKFAQRSGGGGSGGLVSVFASTIRGSGSFRALGGAGGGNSNSRRGGGGGGGRIAVYFNNDDNFTNPQNSSVRGGYGYGGRYGGNGTLAFINRGANLSDKSDDDITAYSGWRWETVDAPFNQRSFTAYNGAVVAGPLEAVEIALSDKYELQNGAVWNANSAHVTMSANDLILRQSARIQGGNFNFAAEVSRSFRAEATTTIEAKALSITGTSTAEFISTAS